MQFTSRLRSKSNTDSKQLKLSTEQTSLEKLVHKIKNTKPKAYILPEGETLSEEDFECSIALQKLKKFEKAVVNNTYVDQLVALELIQKIEQKTTHLKCFSEFISIKQNLQEAFKLDLWPSSFADGSKVVKIEPADSEEDRQELLKIYSSTN